MLFRLGPGLTLAMLFLPVLAGLAGTLLPAFGYFPALGGVALSLDPWRELLAMPGVWRSLGTSALVGFATTLVSLCAVMLFCASFVGTAAFGRLERLLAPLLAVPHLALAFGLSFAIAPSGLAWRLAAPALGLEHPPDLLIVNDPWGLSLAGALILKEIPFLFLMALSGLPQADARRAFALARTLGYRRIAAFVKAVWPGLYGQLRLPVLAVLAYGLSVVDVALVIGPTAPPTLAVETLRLMQAPDLSRHFAASAAATLQLALVITSIGLWLAAERLLGAALHRWSEAGRRRCGEAAALIATHALAALLALAWALALASLVLWSFAGTWRFPELWPSSFTLAAWQSGLAESGPALMRTLAAGGLAVAAALMLTVLCLENEARRGTPPPRILGLLYVPLIVPQIAFLTGLSSLMLALRLDGGLVGVALAHLVFVLPYVFLSLSGPWRALDPRYRVTALMLGASPWRALVRVRLPLMLRPLLAASAVGFAVSVGQYLATLLVGGGRFATLATEAVALAAGGERRTAAMRALLQAAPALIAFWLALVLPALLARRREGGRHG